MINHIISRYLILNLSVKLLQPYFQIMKNYKTRTNFQKVDENNALNANFTSQTRLDVKPYLRTSIGITNLIAIVYLLILPILCNLIILFLRYLSFHALYR